MAHDASHNPSVSGADPGDRPADGVARYGARTVLLLVFGVLLFALGHPTKGPELARILGRLRKRHLDLIVGRVLEGIRLAEEMNLRDAEARAEAEASEARQDAEAVVAEPRNKVVAFAAYRDRREGRGPVAQPSVRRDDFRVGGSRGPPFGMALAA